MLSSAVLQSPAGGAYDLRRMQNRYAAAGLTSAVLFHCLLIGGYYLVNALTPDEEYTGVIHIPVRLMELAPPPSIRGEGGIPQIPVSLTGSKPVLGVPVPVPDLNVSPDATIPTQTGASLDHGAGVSAGTDVQPEVGVPEAIPEDPDAAAFVAVEQEPVPVRMVSPVYPEIALRGSIEGKVIVRMLVTKEGRVKKAFIQRSDADLFNEAALAAAEQWLFTPALSGGGPVTVWVSVPFRFSLRK